MANFSIAITNAVNVLGGGPSTKWGEVGTFTTMVWGSAKWGDGESIPLRFTKIISLYQSTSFDYFSSQYSKFIDLASMTVTMDMGSETLTNGDWQYVFVSDQSEAENRNFTYWGEVSETDQTFTCLTAGTTSWSEV